jgi:hypothetical protein
LLFQHSPHFHCLQAYTLNILRAAYVTPAATAAAAVTAAGTAARQDGHNWGRVGCWQYLTGVAVVLLLQHFLQVCEPLTESTPASCRFVCQKLGKHLLLLPWWNIPAITQAQSTPTLRGTTS